MEINAQAQANKLILKANCVVILKLEGNQHRKLVRRGSATHGKRKWNLRKFFYFLFAEKRFCGTNPVHNC